MTRPIGNGGPGNLSPLPKREMEWGANALSAPQTPSRRLPHVDRAKSNPEIVKAAEGMEAMFIDYMMKVMRQTVPKSDMGLDNQATEIYQGMLDSNFAETAARTGGIGLADQVIAYLESQSYTQNRGAPMPRRPVQAKEADASKVQSQPVQGGTYENKSNDQ